jgi:hypothetical protein
MAVPSVATYSAAALIAAQTSFRDLLDSGSAAGKIRVRDASDVLLVDIPLTDPAGTINGAGLLTITASAAGTAAVTSTAAYGELCNSDNTVYLALPAEAGSVAVSGKIVLNTLSIVSGGPVELVSATIG